MEALWNQYFGGTDDVLKQLWEDESFWAAGEKAEATRSLSGKIINRLKDMMPNLMGGSADLAPSNKTTMTGAGDFSKEDRAGRNLHFGVRELAMTAIGNGMMLHGGLRSYVACCMLAGMGFDCYNLSGGWRLYESILSETKSPEHGCYDPN